MTMHVDLNCDMGESFGAYSLGADAALMPFITSANIACGFHAGDPQVMERTVRLALDHRVAIGAHPGFPDRIGFGRRALDATPDEIESDVLYQIGALAAFARASVGAVREPPLLKHVKAHGALYTLAAVEPAIARALARAAARFDPELIMVCLANSAMVDAARENGLRIAREGFCDRAYRRDGTLRSRGEPGAVIDAPRRAAEQAVQIASKESVRTVEGETISLRVDTLCIHGDTPSAVQIARAVREALEQVGVQLIPMTEVTSANSSGK